MKPVNLSVLASAAVIGLSGCTYVHVTTVVPRAAHHVSSTEDSYSCRLVVKPGPSTLPPKDQTEFLESAITVCAEQYAAHRGYRFGLGADGLIRNAAANAALAIAALPPDSQQQRLSAAEASFLKFIDEMISQSKQIPGYEGAHPGVIGEETYAKTEIKLCPIWPFC